MVREDRVCNPWDTVRIAATRVDLDAEEVVAELGAEALEALRRDQSIAGEPESEQGGALPAALGAALLDLREGLVIDPEVTLLRSGHAERERGLAEHRRDHDVIDHHREREPAGQAHADRADARSAALVVGELGERAQPRHDRAGPPGRPGRELAGDARTRHR